MQYSRELTDGTMKRRLIFPDKDDKLVKTTKSLMIDM